MKPSTLDIVAAFGDEIPVVKQEIRKNKHMITKIDNTLKQSYLDIGDMQDKFSRVFWRMVLEHLKPKGPYIALKRLQTMLFLMRKPGKKGSIGLEAYKDMAIAIERARNRFIVDLYPWEGLKKNYTRFVACCPLHGEKTPSFTIYTKNNSWYCFGCHEGGGPIDFIMKLKSCEFKEAVETLS